MAKNLTTKQANFVRHYLGEAKGVGTKACRLAGYSGNPNTLAGTAYRLLKDPRVREAIRIQKDQRSSGWGLDELREFWSGIVADESETSGNRMKASELLGRSLGAFVEKNITATVSVGDVTALSDDELLRIAGGNSGPVDVGARGIDQARVLTVPSEQLGVHEDGDESNEAE